MPESFGARLRQRREQQHVTLATIVAQTKIKTTLLEALERDDVSNWPAGIFRRAYIRAYAAAIGLEPDTVLREFLDHYPDPAELVDAVAAIDPDRGGAKGHTGPPTRLSYLVGTVIGSLEGVRSIVQRPPHHAGPESAATQCPPAIPAIPARFQHDLSAVAALCTALSGAERASDTIPLLEEAARVLGALGLIVWCWDVDANALRPALAHGYSDALLTQLAPVRREANNAVAAAFRSASICTVAGTGQSRSAAAVPLMTSAGCVGVFAIELDHGCEQSEETRAVVTILAAQLARVIDSAAPAEIGERRLA